jgi:hypothetical protein
MDKPLEKQQPLGSHQRITQSQRNTILDTEDEQRTCVLCYGQHRIVGLGTKVLTPVAEASERIATGMYIRMEIGSSI